VFSIPSLLGLLVLGAGAGAISASLGLGGGIIMVPAFIEFVGMDPHTAKGTSLLIIIFIAALNAWRLNRGYGDQRWALATFLAGGSIVGGYFGGWITSRMSPSAVLWIFIGLLGLLGLRTFFLEPKEVREENTRQRYSLAVAIGILTGVVSGATGTGGGVVLVPLALMAALVTNERVVGLSNLVMVATSIAATLAHLRAEPISNLPWTVGQVNFAVAPAVFIGAQIGSPWGKKLNDRLTLPRRRMAMGVLLILIVVRLVARAVK